MELNCLKQKRRLRRKRRIRKKIFGTAERPRMSVFRSHKNIYVQLVDDLSGTTICEANTRNVALRESISYGGNQEAARLIGQEIAQRAKAKGVARVLFDRNGYRFHGRLKALADAFQKEGIKF